MLINERGESALVASASVRRAYVLLIGGVPLLELLEHAHLNLACIPVLGDGPDDLDCHTLTCLRVDGLNDLAKGPLS